jgi:effector-binding domain-containing protein
MISDPKLEYRKEQPFVAIRVHVGIPFGEVLPQLWGETSGFLQQKGLNPSGPPFIRYLTTDMDKGLDIEVGFPVAHLVTGDNRVLAGAFPAGQYAVLSYFGHYDDLQSATGEFLTWAEKKNITWQTSIQNEQEWWAARIEWYPTDPADETDPAKWQTDLAFLVK